MPRLESLWVNSFVNRIGHKAAFALAMALCLVWSAAASIGSVVLKSRSLCGS